LDSAKKGWRVGQIGRPILLVGSKNIHLEILISACFIIPCRYENQCHRTFCGILYTTNLPSLRLRKELVLDPG
jgi:hypothetical protein